MGTHERGIVMSKELEALARIKKEMIYQLQTKGEGIVDDDFHLIETALKRLEEQESVIDTLKGIIEFDTKLPEIKINEDKQFEVFSALGMSIQRNIENQERELLRNWILKECFPKELRALEIINKKKVDVHILSFCKDYIKYNETFELFKDYKIRQITQEEYDLLKEVLL